MVSILIPVYNYDVRKLAKKLSLQILNINNAEIIFIDDKSNNKYLELNSEIKELPKVTYYQNTVNFGRSKTRNILAQKAKNNFLIFMDGDTLPVSTNFIS